MMNKICFKITNVVVILLIFYVNAAFCDGFLFKNSVSEKNNSQYTCRLSTAQNENNQGLLFSMDTAYSFHFCACHANNLIMDYSGFNLLSGLLVTFTVFTPIVFPPSQFIQYIYHPPEILA